MAELRFVHRLAAIVLGLALVGLAGACAPRGGDRPPSIEAGTPCARCGMGIENLRFAAARRVEGRWRVYDAIECLLADRARIAGGPAWLSDHTTKAMRPADELWVLRGDFPSPMGAGLAAFASRAEAESLAFVTDGVVARLEDVPAVAVEGAVR